MPGHNDVRLANVLVGPKSQLALLNPTERPNQLYMTNDTKEVWQAIGNTWRLIQRVFSERVAFLIAPDPILAIVPNATTEFLNAPHLRAGITFDTTSVQVQLVVAVTDADGIPAGALIRAEFSADNGVTWAPLGELGGPSAPLDIVGSNTNGFERVAAGVLGLQPALVRLVYENGANRPIRLGRATVLVRNTPMGL